MEIYLKFVGETYLESTLGPPLRKLLKYKKLLEVDSAKLDQVPSEKTVEKLIEFVQIFLDSIFFSVSYLPYGNSLLEFT